VLSEELLLGHSPGSFARYGKAPRQRRSPNNANISRTVTVALKAAPEELAPTACPDRDWRFLWPSSLGAPCFHWMTRCVDRMKSKRRATVRPMSGLATARGSDGQLPRCQADVGMVTEMLGVA